jgi:hypothetical protein
MTQRRPRTSGIGFSDPHRGVVERLGTELLVVGVDEIQTVAKPAPISATPDRVGRRLPQRPDIHGVLLVERRGLRDAETRTDGDPPPAATLLSAALEIWNRSVGLSTKTKIYCEGMRNVQFDTAAGFEFPARTSWSAGLNERATIYCEGMRSIHGREGSRPAGIARTVISQARSDPGGG